MRRKNSLPELLAPAGSFEALAAAVAAGADAVYVGGRRFGARAFAKNFDIEEMAAAVRLCHLHGVRLYVAVNTLIEDLEIGDVLNYAAELWRIGVDALIVTDLGVIREIRAALPDFELHASTQMSVHSTEGADAAVALGCKRVVLARELSLSDISSVVERSAAEVEVFLHGALCVSYSGQCLFSSMVGGRSGNRGECAQPCRLPYGTAKGAEYPLSLKDLSLAEHIPELISSGVASLKIEGRMKSAGYVYTVTSIYRRLLDEGRAATSAEMELLKQAFSRDGFTDGYLRAKTEEGMLGIRSEENKEESRKIDELKIEIPRKAVKAFAKIKLGEPAELTITDGERSATAYGEIPAPAQNAPLTKEATCERLSKMGNTYLSLAAEDIELELSDGVNLSPSAINALRRDAAEKFSDFSRELYSFEYKYSLVREMAGRLLLTAEFYSGEEYSAFAEKYPKAAERLDHSFVPLFADDAAIKKSLCVYLPAVITDGESQAVRARLAQVRGLGADAVLVQNIGQIAMAKSEGFSEIFGGFRLNVTNSAARAEYLDMGITRLILSPELTLPKARDISGGTVTYGRIPLMLTERCFMKESFGCPSCGKAALTDRKGEKFPMMREAAHRNLILNSTPTYMGDKQSELNTAGLTHGHLLFTVERAEEINRIISAYLGEKPLGSDVRRMGRRSTEEKRPLKQAGDSRAGSASPKSAEKKSGGRSFARGDKRKKSSQTGGGNMRSNGGAGKFGGDRKKNAKPH